MTVIVPVKSGTFDGVQTNPCGPLGPIASVDSCLNGGILTPGIDYCPTSTPAEYLNDPPSSLYTVGVGPPDPPYTQFTGASGRGMSIALNSGTPVFRKSINSSASANSAWTLYQWQGGLSTTECGIYAEITLFNTPGGSHDAFGLCLGMGADPTVDYNWLCYFFGKVNGSNISDAIQQTGQNAFTTISSSASLYPSITNKIRIELLNRRTIVRFVRLTSVGAVAFEVYSSSISVPPGAYAGVMGRGTGGSGGGSGSNIDLVNFKYGLI